MAFKKRHTDGDAARDGSQFQHASGYTDLAGVLGEHTLDADREAVTTAPKGYRARSVGKPQPRRP